MFVANCYVDVWRDSSDPNYSEYDEAADTNLNLVYQKMPFHLTPYNPVYSNNSGENWQKNVMLANCRNNYRLQTGDEIRLRDGRVFIIRSVERTGGIFYKNSTIFQLEERYEGL